MRFPLLVLFAVAACTRGPSPSEDSSEGQPLGEAPAAESAHEGAPAHPAAPSGRPSGFDPAAPRVGGVSFRAPSPLAYRPATAAMRAAEYVVGGDTAEPPAVLVVHHFPGMGGSTEANLARWIGQFTQPDGRDSREVARVETVTVNGLEVARVDLTGTYAGMQPGSGAAAAPLEGQRLVGAIVSSSEGPVFFKLVGPADVVASAVPAFDELVASVAPVH